MIGTAMETWRAALSECRGEGDPRTVAGAMCGLSGEEVEEVLAEIGDPDLREAVRKEVGRESRAEVARAMDTWRATGDARAIGEALVGVCPGECSEVVWGLVTEEEGKALVRDVVAILGHGFVSLLLSPGGHEAACDIL